MSAPPFLTDDEISAITEPLSRPADQCRVLREMGFLVKQKPNGRPLVARSNFELVMSGQPTAPATTAAAGQRPDSSALVSLFKKGAKYAGGEKTKEQSGRPA